MLRVRSPKEHKGIKNRQETLVLLKQEARSLMIPLLVAEPRERSVEALPLKRDHQDPFRGRNHQHLVSWLNLQELTNLLVQDNPIPIIHPQHRHYSSHNTNVSPTIKSFLSRPARSIQPDRKMLDSGLYLDRGHPVPRYEHDH